MRLNDNRFLAEAVPIVATLLMPLLLAALTHAPFLSRIMPFLVLISIYYWRIVDPESLPYIFLFLLGLMQDALSGLPLGVSSLVYMVFAWLITNQSRLTDTMSFSIIWLGFAVLSLLALAMQWTIMSVYTHAMFPLHLLTYQWLSTLLAYPLIHSLFARLTYD